MITTVAFTIFVFELCGKYDVMPIEFEIYFSEFFEQFSVLSFLPLETLNPFLLPGNYIVLHEPSLSSAVLPSSRVL
jgi:hypothetical protein